MYSIASVIHVIPGNKNTACDIWYEVLTWCVFIVQGTKIHCTYEQQSKPMSQIKSTSLSIPTSTWKDKHVWVHVSFSPYLFFLLWKIELAGGTLSSLCLVYDDHPPPPPPPPQPSSFCLCSPLLLFLTDVESHPRAAPPYSCTCLRGSIMALCVCRLNAGARL